MNARGAEVGINVLVIPDGVRPTPTGHGIRLSLALSPDPDPTGPIRFPIEDWPAEVLKYSKAIWTLRVTSSAR